MQNSDVLVDQKGERSVLSSAFEQPMRTGEST